MNDREMQQGATAESGSAMESRREYQAPKVTKKRSIAKVTLFSGGGATAGGLTASG